MLHVTMCLKGLSKLLLRSSLLLICSLVPGLRARQSTPLASDVIQSLDAVKAEALQHPIAFPLLQELSDGIGPRLTGSAQEARAGRWALDEMRTIGLSNVHPERWQLNRDWHRGYARGRLISPFPLDLTLTSLGWAGSTPKGGVEADVIKVDGSTLDDEIQKNSSQWQNKILLVTPKDPKHADLFKMMSGMPVLLSAAVKAHAFAVIEIDPRPGIMLPHTGPITFAGPSSDLPAVALADEQEQLISRMLDSGKPVRVRLDIQNDFTPGPVPSSNIVGEIPGSKNSEQTVLVGAHLDSWDLGTGAIDDGFGVAAVLGAAKSIIASGVKPKRTIRFVLFTGEEQGLLGSKAYVQMHKGELQNLICAFALDWGNGPITKLPLAGHDELRVPFEELFRSIEDVASVKVVPGFLMSTDAYAFSLVGIPGIAPFQDSPNYSLIAHSAADTLDKVDATVLARDSAILALSALWVADYQIRIGSVWSAEETAAKLHQ